MMQNPDSQAKDLILEQLHLTKTLSKAKLNYLQRVLSIQMLHFPGRNELQENE